MAYPSVYPTGTTVYDRDKCWSGYTIFQAKELGAALIDMNGNVVQLWEGLQGFPNAILPGGFVMGSTGERAEAYSYQDHIDLVQVDWDGNIVWKFDRFQYIEDPGEEPRWMARQHHDYQREGSPVGYYVPGMEPSVDKGNTLVLVHTNAKNPAITQHALLDDAFVEVDWSGNVVWQWVCSDHFEEMGFGEAARNILSRNPNIRKLVSGSVGDWMHINSLSRLGPNRWYDAGDPRFHPENIIWSGRQANLIAIIEKKTGNIVWKLGPDYDTTPEMRKLGWVIGPHHPHIIPKGLPGEGNILIFDNGGWAGYGLPNPGAPTGFNNVMRDFSRVIEIDPLTLKIVWQYSPVEAGHEFPLESSKFYSPLISSAQRLPNGNTMITEGGDGRIFEVTPNHELVWEYLSPFRGKQRRIHLVYRAYRVPYQWIPQLDRPEEIPVPRKEPAEYSLSGKRPTTAGRVIKMEGVRPYNLGAPLCVLPTDR
ncbi:MAG TPA: aryl-sulfate sulfotransferase [Thermodesulfobacteriota bacterium]|nr:aryl-sulfate sulfotransferase [Thermodesulfobacteriota bacterium]